MPPWLVMLAADVGQHGKARMTTPNASGPRQGRPRLRRARTARGWSQPVAAREIYLRGLDLGFRERDLGVNVMQISRWERGEVDPGPIYTTIICDLYERSAELLDLPSYVLPIGTRSVAPAATPEPIRLPSPAAPRTDGPADGRLLADLAALTLSYGGLREVVSPATLLRPVTDHLDVLLRTMPRAVSSADALQVQIATTQTAIIAGWLTFNIGQPGKALAHWLLAYELASEAGHADLTAYALACRSRLHSRVHRGDQAVVPAIALALLDRALALAGTSDDSALRSWLLVNRAEQHADAGNTAACDRDLDAAVHVIWGQGTRDDVFWAHWSAARLDTYRGNCARLLHRPAEAIGVLESFLRARDSRVIPARTNPLTDLAVAYVERGEVEHACELLANAFTAATDAGYTEGVSRVLDMRSTTLAPYGAEPAVKHLDERLRAQR